VAEQLLACEFRDFLSGTFEVSVLLEWCVASLGKWFLNVSHSVQVSLSRVEKFKEENSSLSWNVTQHMFVAFTDVSGQPVGCILDCSTLENGTERPSQKSVINYQHTLLWIPVERRLQLHHSGNPKSRKIVHCFGRSDAIDSERWCHIAEGRWPQLLVIKKPCTL